MGRGGVSGEQANTAAGNMALTGSSAQANANQQAAQMRQAQTGATGFYQNRMNNGLPGYRSMTDYSGGDIAQAFAPQRAQILRQTGMYANQPSGYRDALLTSLGSQQGRAFDSSLRQAMMANEMAKQQGAAGLQGQQQIAGNMALGYGSQGANANQSLLYGPQKTGVAGALGGLAMQGMQTTSDLAKAGAFG
jgi:hypothetical protein